MKPRFAIVLALAVMFLAPPLSAQDDEGVVFALYYRCTQGEESRADEIIRDAFGPIFDRQVAAGAYTTWGLNAHLMGGVWRRLLYWIGTDRDAMLDARDEFVQEIQQDHAAAAQELGTICPSHDDYIWNVVGQNSIASGGGGASLSTYYVCDQTQQSRADSVVTQLMAPVWDQHVSQGTISAWGWLSHRHGGKYRRVRVIGAADAKSLLNAQETIGPDLPPMANRELNEICPTHTDYIWNAVVPEP